MAIFGDQIPRIQQPVSGAVTLTIDLEHARILEDGPEFRVVRHKSELSGEQQVDGRGYHWKFQVLIHLYKYLDSEATYNQLIAKLFEEFRLFRHKNATNPFQNGSGTNIAFLLAEMRLVRLTDKAEYEDGLELNFISKSFVDIEQTLV